MVEDKGAKTAYIDVKSFTKRAVWLAKSEVQKEEFATLTPDGNGVFYVIKQLNHTDRDVVGENCVRNDDGEFALTDTKTR